MVQQYGIAERIFNLVYNWENQRSYKKRHELLNTKIPFKAFDEDTLPYRKLDSSLWAPEPDENPIVFERALSIKRDWSSWFWKKKSEVLKNPEDRKNFQIVTISPKDSKEREGSLQRSVEGKYYTNPDFSEALFDDLSMNQLGPHPIAKYKRGMHYAVTDNEREGKVENRKDVNTVFIVASPVDNTDLNEIVEIANEYRQNGTKEVILIAPNLLREREDKNVGKNKQSGDVYYNGRTIGIDTVMSHLSEAIDRIVTYEPHSARTHSSAALHGIALAPLSLEDELLEGLGIEDASEWAWVRPDEGRNLVATRAEKKYGITGVHLSQLRDSKTLDKGATKDLTPEEKTALEGKKVLLYDDEAGTFGTIKNAVEMILKAELKSINILLGHARLQNGWKENLEEIINLCHQKGVNIKIRMTDSRVPIGDLDDFMRDHSEIEKISVNEKTKKIIRAIVDNVDFWSTNNYREIGSEVETDFERMVLQYISGYDD
jgi:phosphoribosylpyrophosphate synthetase